MAKKTKIEVKVEPAPLPTSVVHSADAHHALPMGLASIDPAAEESQLQVDVDQLRNLMRDTDKAIKQQRKNGLEAGRLGIRIKAKCEELRTVRFVPLLEKNKISVPKLNGYMRSAAGLDLAEQRESGKDHSDRSLPDLAYYADALSWPAKGRRYSCPTPQLGEGNEDAEPTFLDIEVHCGARFSLPHHTQKLVEHIPDLPMALWDCCAGNGEMVRGLQATGRTVIASDIVRYRMDNGEYYPDVRAWDFRCLKQPGWLTSDMAIIGNLPWMAVDKWGPRKVLTHFCGFKPSMICLFLPSSMTGCLMPPRLHPGYTLRDLVIFEKSLSQSTHPISGKTYQESWECQFMVFVPGKQGLVNIHYIEDEKRKRRKDHD